MKNLIILLFFSLLSLFLLVILIILAFLPKLCCCFNSFCNKNYKTIKKRNTRARRIKRARLRLLYKSQVSHEKPIQKELDRSQGVFFDKKLQRKVKDEASFALYKSRRFETTNPPDPVTEHKLFRISLLLSRVGTLSRLYLNQFRNFLMSSVSKYLSH